MFTSTVQNTSSKPELYEELARQTGYLVAGEPNVIANLSNVSALLNLNLQDINWVGFYLWIAEDDQLVLGPFQGKPACLRIPLNSGVCGTAAVRQETVVVEDVNQFSGHIACDAASQSEVVVPLVQDGQLIGVLDIDSPHVGRFDEDDARGLEKVAAALLREVRFGN